MTQYNTERIDPDLSKQRHGCSIFRLKCIIHTCLMINYTYLSITYMAVLDEFLLTSVQVWEKKF